MHRSHLSLSNQRREIPLIVLIPFIVNRFVSNCVFFVQDALRYNSKTWL